MTTDRRRFLRTGLLWNAAAMTASVCPVADAGSAGRSMAHGVDAFEFDEITIAKLQEGMTAGRFSAHSLVRKYLARIKAIDRQGRRCTASSRSTPTRSPSPWRSIASARRGGPRGPLHGIPVLIKDNIDTADRMATTAGSLALGRRQARRATRFWSASCARRAR